MSFPFYRNSASRNRSRDEIRQERNSMVAPNQHATQDYDVTVVEERTSSRFRIPFLMKKRKSMVTLRSTGMASMYDDRGRPRKTVSQLADETAARFARSSFGRGDNLELPSVNLSSLSLSLSSNNATPKKRKLVGRRSGFSSTTSLNTSMEIPPMNNASEKSKSSIFSRVASRPLSSRNSSADLKSSTFRSYERSPGRRSPTHSRPKITLATSPVKEYLEDDLFTAPRLAPTPPSLTINTQGTSLKHPNTERSPSTLSPYTTRNGSKSLTPTASNHSLLTQSNPPSSQIAFASPQSSTDLDTTPQRQWVKSPKHSSLQVGPSPVVTNSGRVKDHCGRIGRERLTLSVANALEEGLGINIGDETDEDSIYGQSTEDHAADGKREGTYSGLAVAPATGVAFQEHKQLASNAAAALETQSPLSMLISANGIPQLPATPLKNRIVSPSTESPIAYRAASTPEALDNESKVNPPSFVGDASALDSGINDANGLSNVDDLKQLLDFQCSRFDRVAKHLLEIISRHETQKVQYESQLSTMKKEAAKRDREIKRLHQLLEVGCSCGLSRTHLFSVAPSRKAMSSTASLEDHLLGYVSDKTSKNGDNETRLSVDASPLTTPLKEKRKAMTLKRSKTMPQLHANEDGLFAPSSPSPVVPSPDVSGLSLQFPIPKPLSVQSIASTILSSAPTSSLSVPPLTSSTTLDDDESVASPRSEGFTVNKVLPSQTDSDFFQFTNKHYTTSKAAPVSNVRILASDSYARNLNKDHGPSIRHVMDS